MGEIIRGCNPLNLWKSLGLLNLSQDIHIGNIMFSKNDDAIIEIIRRGEDMIREIELDLGESSDGK